MPTSRGFSTKTLKTPLSLSVAFGLRAELLSALMRTSSQRSLLSSSVALRNPANPIGKNTVPLRFTEKGGGNHRL